MRNLLLSILVAVLFAAPVAHTEQRDLDQWYRGYDHKYFQDELPQDVIISRTLADDRFMAITFYDSGHYHIELNPKYNISTKSERINLLHESCHVEMFVEKEDEFDDHGPHWQACMHRLSNQGAFEDLW